MNAGCGNGTGQRLFTDDLAGLMLTVCHRTFSGQFKHLSDQFHYLTGKISIGSHIDQTSLLENVRTRC